MKQESLSRRAVFDSDLLKFDEATIRFEGDAVITLDSRKSRLIYFIAAIMGLCLMHKSNAEVIYSFLTPFQPIYVSGYYIGEHRELDFAKRKYFNFAINSFPGVRETLKLYKKEIYFHGIDGIGMWLPLQDDVFDELNQSKRSKYGIKLFCRKLGAVDSDQMVVVIGFSFLENVFIDELLKQ